MTSKRKSQTRSLLALLASAVLVPGSYLQAASFTNGSFENPDVSGTPPDSFGTVGQVFLAGDAIGAWSVDGPGYIALVAGNYYGAQPTDANQHIGFNSGDAPVDATTISQTFDTVAGKTYKVLFDVGRGGTGPGDMGLSAGAYSPGNLFLGGLSASAPITIGYNLNQEFSFIASGPSTSLRFTDISGATDSVDVLLDNVRVQVANTPDGGSLLIPAAGLALLLRSRKSGRSRE